MKRLLLTILLALLLFSGCGFVDAAEPADYSKILVMHLNISQGSVTEKSVEMVYGHAPNPGLQYGDLKGLLKTAGGETLREFDIWDTRYQLADVQVFGNESSDYLSGHLIYNDTADLTLILPYQEEEMNFELYDKKSGNLLKSVNLSPAISQFRSTYPKEQGGISYSLPPIKAPLVYLITGIVLAVLLMGMILSMVRKK